MLVLTFGHSTRAIEEFLEILHSNLVTRLIDVRSIPRSRHNPQFSQESLSESLRNSSIDYVGVKALGGLRRPKADSPNMGWRNSSFRGFADYMRTQEFANGIDMLTELSQDGQIVIMCAEVLPWRCHRWLIADALFLRGISVEHIISTKKRAKHTLTKWAHIEGTQITYPETAT